MIRGWRSIGPMAVLSFSLFCAAAFAPSVQAQYTIDGVQPQRTISGPAWTADKLTGKVVLIVLWGAKVPPSYKPLARAARIDQELAPYGLVVLGPNLQKADDVFVEAKVKAMGVKFSVTDNIGIKGMMNVNLPMSIVFAADGRSIFEGPSDKAEARARSALGAAIVDRTMTKTWSTGVQPIVDNLRKGISPATVLPNLVSRKSEPDAKKLIEAICFSGKEQLDDAKERIESDPVGAYNDAQRISTVFRGTPLGTQSSELFTKLKNDAKVQQELKAHPSLEKVTKIDEFLENVVKMDPSKSDPSMPEFQKKYQSQISQIRVIATQMRATWPMARATSEASDIAMKYGVMFK